VSGARGDLARGGAPDALTVSADAERLIAAAQRLRAEVGKRIVGQHAVVEEILMALVAGGHALLVGVPGLAKTLMIKSLADAMRLEFRRIQFTPDLVPSDITGTEILEESAGGARAFRFVQGPVFANIVLADEINRAPPRTQAALLEAMQEHSVTAAGKTMRLPEPFFVLATQNPIEQEGTYPLPEAQLDRFLFDIRVGYPGEQEEIDILRATTGGVASRSYPCLAPRRPWRCNDWCASCHAAISCCDTRRIWCGRRVQAKRIFRRW
jgi:MoxR-like ATPase